MHMLKQMDPDLYLEVLRKQAQVWDDLIAAFEDTWTRWANFPGPRRTAFRSRMSWRTSPTDGTRLDQDENPYISRRSNVKIIKIC